ncbi:hypothetical protein AB1Y20_013538 [Prymnesium parvum]|uniref:Uncharacterized protein n=1 Tax=Prymnesium parvum TaxID=97485 RepID=A0AB34IIZ2_PRYPA
MSCTGGSYPLHLACELGGDPGSILAILSHHTDAVHITDDDGDLPIHAAAAGQASPQVIDALLSAFPESIRQTNKLGMLPLHKATKFPCGRLEKCSAPGQSVVPLVQAYPGAVRVRDKEGCIPLQYALVHNRSEGLHVDAASTGADKEAMPTHALVALVSKDMPIDLADGHPNTSHTFSWNHCVSTPGLRCARAVEIVLSTDPPGHGYGKHIAALAESPDEQGRPAIDAASREARQAIYAHLLFCGRYQLHFGPPEHRSATSVVLRARDQSSGLADYRAIFDKFDTNPKDGMLNPDELRGAAEELGLDAQLFLFRGSSAFKGDLASKTRLVSRDDFIATCKRLLGDGPREVVLKLMQDETQWRREKQSRSKQGLSARFIVQTLDAPPDDDVAAAVRAMNGDLRRLKDAYLPSITMGIRILVMDAADRNLFQVYQQERPDINAIRMILQQVAEALAHLHALGLMHGDVKMLNIVRFRLDGRLRLIDFDAGAIISDEEPSYAGAKFSSAILPPELLYELKGEADGAQLQAYWQQSDTDLQAKVAPLTLGGRSFAVRSFRSDANDEPIVEGLPYALEEASDKIDCWALGVLAYVLGAAEPLVSSTRDDDCASGGAMALLHDWGTKPKQVLARLNKVHDPALCDLVSKLLQRDAEKRLSAREALEHVFFRTGRDGGEVAPQQEVLDALKRIEAEQLEAKAEQKRQTAMLAAIQELSVENRSELAKTRTVLLKGIFEAAEVQTPTAFVVLRSKLPDPPSGMKARQPALKMEGDGSGFAVETGLINVSFTDEGVEMSSELLETYKSRFDEGMTWVTRLKAVGSMTLQGDVGGAFETIREGLGDLITAETMYLYLIDELTGEPVRGPGYPIEIKTPAEVVPKLLPVMQVGLRAMAVYNGAAGIGRAFGFPVPKVPKAWRQGAQQSVELLKQESSVAAFSVVHKQVKKTAEESQTVRGASLRELQKFFEANDKQGRFAGLQRIGDPENGTALWTTLSDPKQVKLALEERTRQREQELRAQGQQELLDNQVQQTPNPADSRGGLSRQLEELAQQQEKERCVTQAKLQQVLDEIQGMKAAGVCCVIS